MLIEQDRAGDSRAFLRCIAANYRKAHIIRPFLCIERYFEVSYRCRDRMKFAVVKSLKATQNDTIIVKMTKL